MYLLTELILFSPVIIYACVQVRRLIPGSRFKHLFVFLCILLFLGYPAAEMASHQSLGGWMVYLVICLYYCLPYLLYLTLCVVAIDIVIALARGTKRISLETVSTTRFQSCRLGCYIAIPALVVAAGAWNNDRLLIKDLSVELPQKSSTIRELHIVFASDFHLSEITTDHLVERFVDKVNALHPDIVLIGGDVLEGHRNEDLDKFETQFRRIRSKYGVYAAPGNHERFRGGANEFYSRCGMRFMEDRVEKIDNAFYLACRKNARFSGRKPILDLLKDAPENLPVILVDHGPTDLENVSKSRVDLQFSGHTHNGQLFPVNLVVMPFEYELAWGTMKKRNTTFIVSSGVQAWGPPVKTAGDSEILSVKVKFIPQQCLSRPVTHTLSRFKVGNARMIYQSVDRWTFLPGSAGVLTGHRQE